MKTKFFFALVVIPMSFFLLSCSNDDDNSNNNTQDANEVTALMTSDLWRVSSMVDSGQDETNDFVGFTFDFVADGTLIATNNQVTYTGAWSITQSSSSSDDDLDFNITFPVSDDHDFDDLNDDWDIVSFTQSEIRLIDISGGNGGTDTLVFTKI